MGAYAGACLLAASVLVILPIVLTITSSLFAAFLALATSCAIAAAGALLATYGAYLNDLETERRRSGCCPRCGYDLRESTGRCPECGRAFRRG